MPVAKRKKKKLGRLRVNNKMTAMMVEDMIFDPILATKVIFDLKVPPHEELRILWMWSKYFTADDSGFSTGKSFTFALISALRSILFPGRISGLISKTFSQGKLIFQNYDRWYHRSRIFRACISHINGKPRLVHATDAWVAHFVNGSEARTLPPDFMKDSERVRSERWHDGYFDEWTVYGNMTALNKTLIARCSKENDYRDCPVRQNHIHLGSTPTFTYHPAYQVIKRVAHQKSQGNKNYGRFSCNFRHVPDTKKWKFLIDRKTIFHMQTVLPTGLRKTEIDGVWQKDSGSFYSSKEITEVRFESCLPILNRQNPDDVLIGGMDVARGGADQTSQRADDFSLSILLLRGSNPIPRHMLTIRYNNVTARQMSGAVHKWHMLLGLSVLVYDPGGGGLFVVDELRKETQEIDGKSVQVVPVDDIWGGQLGLAHHILFPFRRGFFYVDKMEGKMLADSVLVNKMHLGLQTAIQNKEIFLAPAWQNWTELGVEEWDADTKREHLNKKVNLSDEQKIAAEMDLCVTQLMLVDIDRDENKQPILDKAGMYKFGSKAKKDSAYSLCYGHYGTKFWNWKLASEFNEAQEGGLSVFASSPF